MSSYFFFIPLPHGIAINMAVVNQSTYEAFVGGTEVYAMDMDDKIKGVHLRGTKYTVSQDGLCPRCGNSNRLYVILDKLFPMGDMPEILHTLIAKGRAILWSSQEKEGYRDPPTFLCRGFCPSDPLGAGFNVNWDNVSLNQILESLDRPAQKAINPVSSSEESSIQVERSSQDESSDNSMQVLDEFRAEKSDDERNLSQTSVMQSSSDKEEETEEDDDDEEEEEDDDELDEEELIKQMLAKEQQKLSQENNHDDTDDNENEEPDAAPAPSNAEHFSEQTTSSSEVISSTTTVTTSAAETVSHSKSGNTVSSTANTYPVSSTGRCPYCGASDVKYIIIVSENTKDTELPQSLQELLKRNHAFKMAKVLFTNASMENFIQHLMHAIPFTPCDSEPPSFQCQKCQYGFNLNWSKTNLEEIFGLQPTTSAPAATTAAPYTSTASMPYQARPSSYMTSTAYPHYPRPSVLPPGYPPPVGVPPPVPYHGYPPTYPSYYGSYYHPPAIPQPAGSYSPYSPAVAPPRIPLPGTIPPGMPPPGMLPPGIPPPGIPPTIPPPGISPPAVPHPGIPPPGIPTPGIPPPAILPPGIPPPGIPTPGIPPPVVPPPRIPPPVVPPARIPPPGYLPPAAPGIPPPSTAWGSYTRPTYPTRPHYPPTSTQYLLPGTGRPFQPPPQIVTPLRAHAPRPLYQPSVGSGMSAPPGATPSLQEPSAEQTVEGEISKVAAARFEMVLNQIDLAKARVRHEKELMKEFQKEVLGTTATDTEMLHQQDTEEPNALTDEGQSMPEYDEKPPGDDDTGFGSNVIITQSLEETTIVDLPVNTSIPAHSVSPSQPVPADINEKPEVPVHENYGETSNVIDNAVVETDLDSKIDQDDEDVENYLPQTVETSPQKTVPTRGGRPGRSKQQNRLPPPTAVASTRQTRRSRRSEPTTSTEDTDSTAGEEEAAAVTGRSRRSQKTRPPSRGVKRLEIGTAQDEEVHGGVVVSDVEMGGSSDVLSQSSAVPQTESDSQEVPSESLPSSSEAEAAPVAPSATARPQRARATRGRKRKQESVVNEVEAPEPSARKSRRVAAGGLTIEEPHSEENDEVVDEKMLVDNPVVLCEGEDTEMTTTSPRVGRSKRGVTQPDRVDNESTVKDSNLDQSETESTAVTQEPIKPNSEIPTNKRQTRKSAQLPQEPEALTVSETRTDSQTEGSTVSVQEEEEDKEEAQEDEKTTSNRRTRRSTPRHVSQESIKAASHRQTRKSLQHSQESDPSDTEQKINSEQDQALESDTPSDNKFTDGQPSVFAEQKEIAPNNSLGNEGKTNRRIRKSRKSSASSEDTSVSNRVDVHVSQESDASATTEELTSHRQTRSRKSPALRKLETTQSDSPTVGEAEKIPQTRKSRRRSSTSNEDATTDVQLSVAESDTPEVSVSSRRTRRNKSSPTTRETTELSQELDSLTAEGDIEEDDSVMPQKRASRKIAPVESTATVTKRVTRNRQKK